MKRWLFVLVGICSVVPVAVARGKFVSREQPCLHNQRCQKLSNGSVFVLLTLDVGPRVLGYGFEGEDNVFAELPLGEGQTPNPDKFYGWGGHRLWHAPEVRARTYEPDNQLVQVVLLGPGHLRLTASPEAATGLQKKMEVKLEAQGSRRGGRHWGDTD